MIDRTALLLSDPSACLRYQVLRQILKHPEDDPEVKELIEIRLIDPLLTDLLRLQDPDGSWKMGVMGDPLGGGIIQSTGLALARIGKLGFGLELDAVQRGANFLFSKQLEDGSWPLPRDGDKEEGGGYSMIPLQTAFPLRGLAACGYATDLRCERAYEWLLTQRLADGAWPTGIASGNYGYVAGYRRLAHSRWGCRSNTTASLACLVLHPVRRTSSETKRALDLLLGRETRERQPLGLETARLLGAERMRGFISYFARFDQAFILSLAWKGGATLEDERIAEMCEYLWDHQGPYGLWEYQPKPQVSRWITFDILRTLVGLDENSQQSNDWQSLEPRTPFQAYPKRPKRY